MIYVGIDPGDTGGLAAIEDNLAVLDVRMMPMIGKELDYQTIRAWFDMLGDEVSCAVEVQIAMPGQNVAAMAKHMTKFGIIQGIIIDRSLPLYLVRAQDWMQQVLKGLTKGDKSIAINYILKAYPYVDLAPDKKQKPQSGMADALCIARYCKWYLMDQK